MTAEHDTQRPVGANRAVANMDGPAALPRWNGELVFEAPWEGRIFAMAVALHEQGLYDWNTFRDALIAEIAHAEATGEPSSYYERWLKAFATVLGRCGLLDEQEIASRTAEFLLGQRDKVF